MTAITTWAEANNDSIAGTGPVEWYGTAAVDGDEGNWKDVPIGSVYYRRSATANLNQTYRKVKDDKRDDDWFVWGFIAGRLLKSQFTDGGSTSGTYTYASPVIPLGCNVRAVYVTNVVAWSGDTSATITFGDGTDVDRYNTGTPSLFADLESLPMGVPSGTKDHVAAKGLVITVTTASDFTAVPATAAFSFVLLYEGLFDG